MSFGFSVGDFLTASALAWKLYRACKDSPSTLSSIANDVCSLHIILKETGEFKDIDTTSDPNRRDEIRFLLRGCNDVLKELEGLVKKYDGMGTSAARKFGAIRFAMENVKDIQDRVVAQVGYLTAFNTSHTRRSLQRLEQKLDKFLREIELGLREGSVVNSVSAVDLAENNDDVWRVIQKELADVGVTAEMMKLHIEFIKEWFKSALEHGRLQEASALSPPLAAPTRNPTEAILRGGAWNETDQDMKVSEFSRTTGSPCVPFDHMSNGCPSATEQPPAVGRRFRGLDGWFFSPRTTPSSDAKIQRSDETRNPRSPVLHGASKPYDVHYSVQCKARYERSVHRRTPNISFHQDGDAANAIQKREGPFYEKVRLNINRMAFTVATADYYFGVLDCNDRRSQLNREAAIKHGCSIGIGQRWSISDSVISRHFEGLKVLAAAHVEQTIHYFNPSIFGVRRHPKTYRYDVRSGRTILHVAAIAGVHHDTLNLLINRVLIGPNVQDASGNTPMHYAVCYGHAFTVSYLIYLGADMESRNKNGLTPMHLAALGPYAAQLYGELRLVIDDQSEPFSVTREEGNEAEPLYSEIMGVLIDGGCKLSCVDFEGSTPLHWAARLRNTALVKRLLEAGADASIVNMHGKTFAREVPIA